MNIVSAIATAIGNIFGWLTNRSTLRNTTSVVAAKQGQADANEIAKTNNAIEKKDTDEIRKELAE